MRANSAQAMSSRGTACQDRRQISDRDDFRQVGLAQLHAELLLEFDDEFDKGELIRIDPAFQDTLSRTDFSRARAADFGPLFSSIQAGAPPMTSEYVRRHHFGVDGATVVGPVGLRLDVGYDTRRVFLRPDVTGASSPAVQATVSLEYQTGDVRKVVLVEGSVLRLRLIRRRRGSSLRQPNRRERHRAAPVPSSAVVLLQSFDCELRAVVSALPESVLLRPQVAWRSTSHLTFSVGGLWLTGEPWSVGYYFMRNSELYLDGQYSF